jgi:hypothetical protein
MSKKLKIIIAVGAILTGGIIGLSANTWGFDVSEYLKERAKADPCLVCFKGCNPCPEGCELCLNSEKRKIDPSPNWKWYYNPLNIGPKYKEIETDTLK